jgi:hypothetical protein
LTITLAAHCGQRATVAVGDGSPGLQIGCPGFRRRESLRDNTSLAASSTVSGLGRDKRRMGPYPLWLNSLRRLHSAVYARVRWGRLDIQTAKFVFRFYDRPGRGWMGPKR